MKMMLAAVTLVALLVLGCSTGVSAARTQLATIASIRGVELTKDELMTDGMSGKILKLGDNNFDELVYGTDKVFFVNFYTPGCSLCKQIKQPWEKLAYEYGTENDMVMSAFSMMNLQGSINEKVKNAFNIKSYPTLLLFRGHTVVDRIEGGQYNAIKYDMTNARYVSDFRNFLDEHLMEHQQQRLEMNKQNLLPVAGIAASGHYIPAEKPPAKAEEADEKNKAGSGGTGDL